MQIDGSGKQKVLVPAARAPRADAARNYHRLLQIATRAFSEQGKAVRMEEIARSAGVGIGTLYRHFPTRERLIQEVYRNEVEELVATASTLVRDHSPTEALRRWLHLFVDYMATQRILAEALHVSSETEETINTASGLLIGQAIDMLVQQTRQGVLPAFTEPGDLLRGLVGVATIYPRADWKKGAKDLADLMVAGLCPDERSQTKRPQGTKAKA